MSKYRKRKVRFKKRVKSKKNLGIFILLFFIVLVIIFINRNKPVEIKMLNTQLYIEAADKASAGKLQVNWKYLAAIDAVRYKDDFSKASASNVDKLANMFVQKNSKGNKGKPYKIVALEEVLNKLYLEKKDKEKVYSYIEGLKSTGLIKNSIKEDSSNARFIKELSPKAIEIYKKDGILPSILIAQAALETGWGKSELCVKANNLFGIKADSSWKGRKIKMKTSENYNDVIKANFRKYSTKEDSIADYSKFLEENRTYKENGFFDATTYVQQAKALEKAGYSTVAKQSGDKIYSELIISIIREHNLQLIDCDAESDS